MFRIGFDCHRTFLDTNTAIRRYIRNKFKIDIPPTDANRRNIVERYLDLTEYENVLDTVITKIKHVVRHVKEVPGAIQAITDLQSDGHYVEMVTSSSYEAHIATIRWLKHYEVIVPTRAIGRQTLKGAIAKDYDIFLDDRIEQAEACILGGTPFVFLLNTPTNQAENVPECITRVPDWTVFCQEVRTLAHRLYPQSL